MDRYTNIKIQYIENLYN